MSALSLLSTCATCGSEESLRILAEIVTISLPLGGKLVRYIRLHKPAKHVLRIEKVSTLLKELAPDLRRGVITVKGGRDWAAPVQIWSDALDEVFRAQNTGTLNLPLQGNGYLYAVITRLSNSIEASAERTREIERQQRAYRHTEPSPLAALAAAVVTAAPPALAEPTESPVSRGVPDWIKAAQQKLAASSAGVRAESAPTPTTTPEN
jgi:hypothetical protein